MSLKTTALNSLNAAHRVASRLPAVGAFRPLRGGFSALEALQSGELDGCLTAKSQVTGSCPAGSMTELAGFQQNDHQPWPYFWTVTGDARLVGQMLHWRDPQDRICLEGVYHLPERRRLREDRPFAQMWVPHPKKLPGAWTSITSPWNDCSNYYHWLLDGLTRLCLREELPEQTKILIPEKIPRFALETFRLLGLEQITFATSSACVQPERYYFCSPLAMTGVWNPRGYEWLRKSFSIHFEAPRSGPPIFLTRRGRARIPENLAQIEIYFKNRGFEIVDCGAIQVKQQIQKISAAPAVAGLHGAAMTNLLWASPGIPVIEIFQCGYVNGCYEQIAFAGNLNYVHTINHPDILEILQRWNQDF